ncbi:hypothetical protein BO94DRAFT_609313 [Aspergillus sclerotioniger CBS 115572]|uniref:Uncharacterized protein n=1 Tax=Aspergillus sclerotioniger CBS 115572 TaxID=1450535 RepID=A0A317V943_9EURO|nr:hypothetical protein BO94DRAFT_609313 [Aspergillus sclerotioniger CBS 115572]PWY70893.1 hypothetical protein BO94DRAFT_609313 [Aspergillus sclerotioniger CBS 115572]
MSLLLACRRSPWNNRVPIRQQSPSPYHQRRMRRLVDLGVSVKHTRDEDVVGDSDQIPIEDELAMTFKPQEPHYLQRNWKCFDAAILVVGVNVSPRLIPSVEERSRIAGNSRFARQGSPALVEESRPQCHQIPIPLGNWRAARDAGCLHPSSPLLPARGSSTSPHGVSAEHRKTTTRARIQFLKSRHIATP